MSYSAMIMSQAPLGYWRLNEPAGTSGAGSVLDSSGNSYHGTPTNVTFAQSGPLAGGSLGASFNGASSKIVVAGSGITAFNGTGFAISAWVNETGGSYPFILDRSYANHFGFYCFGGNNKMGGGLKGTSGGAWESPAGYGAAYSNVWTHLAMMWTPATYTVTFYNNAVETSVSIGNRGGGLASSTSDIYIGAAVGNQYWWNGALAEVALWNRPLTATEILHQYNAGRTNSRAGQAFLGFMG